MEWITIEHRGEMIDVADFLDGILVVIDPPSMPIFVPGWHTIPQRGDMDGPNVRRNKITHPPYRLAIVAEA